MEPRESDDLLLSICITSYKRIDELKRCLKSINTKYIGYIEIVISEDHSEQRELIKDQVELFQKSSEIKIKFNSNNENLGYDRNLHTLISLAKGKYILFLSDDDSLVDGALDQMMEWLFAHECNVAFGPFKEGDRVKRKYGKTFTIPNGKESIKKYLLDSILFSGLIFRRVLVNTFSAERFKNLNYFQVYLFINVLYHYDAHYVDILLVNCNGDGENAFGISTSSVKNDLLADRTSVFSNLEFHKGLIKTIRIFDQENFLDIWTSFSKEYSLRAYQGLAKARKHGIKLFRNYWEMLNSLDIKLSWMVHFYHLFLLLFGSKISNLLISIPKAILLSRRQSYSQNKER